MTKFEVQRRINTAGWAEPFFYFKLFSLGRSHKKCRGPPEEFRRPVRGPNAVSLICLFYVFIIHAIELWHTFGWAQRRVNWTIKGSRFECSLVPACLWNFRRTCKHMIIILYRTTVCKLATCLCAFSNAYESLQLPERFGLGITWCIHVPKSLERIEMWR